MQANVISSCSFIRPAMFDLELEPVNGGGRGRGKDEKTPVPEEAVEKQTPTD